MDLADVRRYNGDPLAADSDLYLPPPESIGKVLYADSNLKESAKPHSTVSRTLAGLLGAAVGGGLVWGLQLLFQGLALQALLPIAALIGGAIGLHPTLFNHVCSYVGEDGAVFFHSWLNRERVRKELLVRFGAVEELHIQVTDTPGHLRISYDWRDKDGSSLMRYRASRMSFGKRALRHRERFAWAVATELAWCQHYLSRHEKDLEDDGIHFNISDIGWIKVNYEFMELSLRGEKMRLAPEDVTYIGAGGAGSNNRFVIIFLSPQCEHHKAYKDGRIVLKNDQIANARAMLMAAGEQLFIPVKYV